MNLKKQVIVTAIITATALGIYSAHAYAPSHPEFATIIRVSLFEWGISLEQPQVVEGGVIFEIVNEGTMNHAFKIGGLPIGTAETESFSVGSSRTLNVELPPGEYEIWCPIPGHRAQGMETTLRVTAALPTPPPPGSSGSPSDYDDDGNCFLSDSEFFVAIDFWIDEVIGNELFFEVVDAWIAEANVCAAALSVNTQLVSASMSAGDGVTFTSSTASTREISVEIFDLNGTVIAQERTQGNHLRWDLANSSGIAVPNGVYLYRAAVRNSTGGVVSDGVRKFVVMR